MANAADPLNAIGLALASLTSPVSLFSGCVQAYSVLAGVKDAGNAIHHQHWLFKIEHTRLLVWGQNFDAFGDGLNPEKLSRPVYEAVVTTLAQIELLLQDAAKISANYGLRRETDRELPSNFTGLLEQQRDLVSHLDRSSSFLRRARWAIHDQASFARLVEQLRGYNDALYQFCPVEKRHHLTVAVETETLARTIIEDGLNGVRELQLQAMQNSPPPQIQILGRRAAARLWADERTREEDEDTVPHRPLHAMSLDDMEILSELRNDTPTRRAWARHLHRYAPPYTSTDLVIEWRPYNERHVKERLQRRIEALVRMLQQTPKPPSFRALDCLGFLEDTKRPRFGLVFRFPQECQTSSTGAPLTLFQILSERESPYLGERFLLAAFLAEALYEFHARLVSLELQFLGHRLTDACRTVDGSTRASTRTTYSFSRGMLLLMMKINHKEGGRCQTCSGIPFSPALHWLVLMTRMRTPQCYRLVPSWASISTRMFKVRTIDRWCDTTLHMISTALVRSWWR